MTLREKQSAFAFALANFITWIFNEGCEVTLSEGYVGDTDAADGDYDGPHKQGGQHYLKLAQDINLFIDGKLITNAEHPAWKMLGRRWKQMDSLARWGGDWSSGDANHFSFEHEGKA